MLQRTFLSAFTAILFSAVLVQTAAAVPSRARTAVVTVSETYNPLNFNLDTLVDGTDALDYTGGVLSFQVDVTGTFDAVGYSATGGAGSWTLSLSGNDVTVSPTNFILNAADNGIVVGTLTYNGGITVVLPAADTPAMGDVFRIYSTQVGPVFDVVCQDGTVTCDDFDLALTQPLLNVGPYVGLTLDTTRYNPNCNGNPDICGFSLRASSVPEPATLALLGLGLAGLGLSRRARA